MVCVGAGCRSTGPAAPIPVSEPALVVGGRLAETVWTNYIARTNGRSMSLWSKYTHPAGWPTSAAPVLAWNPDSLVTAYRNYTGISQCWEGEGNRGQVPMTLLTRRHAYTRGHHTGAPSDGQAHLQPSRAGQKVWFVTADNRVVEARIANWLTRLGRSGTNAGSAAYCDYSLVIFSRDLPEEIVPMKVMSPEDYRSRFASDTNWPKVVFQTEQGGRVSAGLAPFNCDTWKGGDSGSPNLLPIGDWLVFFGGRSTTGPTPQMQADIDTLTRSLKLDPKNYQLDWVVIRDENWTE
jgi:hypothetical protein